MNNLVNPVLSGDVAWAISGDYRASLPARAAISVAENPSAAKRTIEHDRYRLAIDRLANTPQDIRGAAESVADKMADMPKHDAVALLKATLQQPNGQVLTDVLWARRGIAHQHAESLGVDFVGWSPWKSIKKAAKKVSRVARKAGRTINKVASNKLLRTAAGGVAFVCPAVGVPAVTALTVAAKITKHAQSKNKKKRKVAMRTIRRTKALARSNRDAKRGLKLLQITHLARRRRAAKARTKSLPVWKKKVIAAITAAK